MGQYIPGILQCVGLPSHKENIFSALFKSAQNGDPDCGGLLSYNYLSGEHIVNLSSGCPLFLYGPDSRFTLPNFMRTHLFTALTTLRIGMDILASENVRIDRLSGHGGFFKTPGVGQLFLASALRVPVSILHNAERAVLGGWLFLPLFWSIAVRKYVIRFWTNTYFPPCLIPYLNRIPVAPPDLSAIWSNSFMDFLLNERLRTHYLKSVIKELLCKKWSHHLIHMTAVHL